jgi:hypothetical protein
MTFDTKPFGRYNDYPPNWKECSEDEFWGRFMTYPKRHEEYRQMRRNNTERFVSAHLYFYDQNEGLALVNNYDWVNYKHQTPKLYKFALCEHEWEHTGTPYNCCRTYTCTKCGDKKSIDSSG